MGRRKKPPDDGQLDWFGGYDTLAVARQRLMAFLDRGTYCPCCDQYARRYKRKLYSSQAMQLIRLYKLCRETDFDPDLYYHRSVVIPYANNNDLALLRHWGVLALQENKDRTKRESGRFRVTDLGRKFVEGVVTVPAACYQYNDEVQKFTDKRVTIYQALGTKFSYEDLMSGEITE